MRNSGAGATAEPLIVVADDSNKARQKRYQHYSFSACAVAVLAAVCAGGVAIASLIISGQDLKKGNEVFYGAIAGVGVSLLSASVACCFSKKAKRLKTPRGPTGARPGMQN